MKKISRRQYKNKKRINNADVLSLKKYISILKSTATANFVETFEAHINLNLSLKNLNRCMSKTITFPHNIAKKNKIVVLTTNKYVNQAKRAEADLVVTENSIDELFCKTINFNVVISTPEMMPKLAKFGRLLGPKGLMPSLKAGTLINNSELVCGIKEFKKGKLEYKIDKGGTIHLVFGKYNSSEIQLIENLKFLHDTIKKNKPINFKGDYFKSIFICATMGPSIKLNLNILN
jgi:large subunit ribosomal protein L1